MPQKSGALPMSHHSSPFLHIMQYGMFSAPSGESPADPGWWRPRAAWAGSGARAGGGPAAAAGRAALGPHNPTILHDQFRALSDGIDCPGIQQLPFGYLGTSFFQTHQKFTCLRYRTYCLKEYHRFSLRILIWLDSAIGLNRRHDQCCGAGPLLTGSGSRYFFFTGSGSSSYKNRLKSSKKHVFAFTSLHRLGLRPKKYRLRPAPAPQHWTWQ